MSKAPKCPTCGRRINGAHMFLHLQCANGGQDAFKLNQKWANDKATETLRALDNNPTTPTP